jgi:hypothetical protein
VLPPMHVVSLPGAVPDYRQAVHQSPLYVYLDMLTILAHLKH